MIYFDHNATTRVLPEVLEAMMPYFISEWGNPSSTYKFGSKMKSVVETARGQIAELVGAQLREIIFTSCGTESNNAACGIAGQPRQATHRHIGGGTFIGAQLLHRVREGWLPGDVLAGGQRRAAKDE